MENTRSRRVLFTKATHTSAFSLTELLIVTTIITILAALLVPVLVSIRARADQTTCAHNLGQLGISLSLYAEENDGAIIWYNHGPFTNLGYVRTLSQYVSQNDPNQPVWHCPSSPYFPEAYAADSWYYRPGKDGNSPLRYYAPLSIIFTDLVPRPLNSVGNFWAFGLR